METRYNSDGCRIMKKLQESTDQGVYMLNRPGNGERPPYIADPHIRLQGWGANRVYDHNGVDFKKSMLQPTYSVYAKDYTMESRAVMPAWTLRGMMQPMQIYLKAPEVQWTPTSEQTRLLRFAK